MLDRTTAPVSTEIGDLDLARPTKVSLQNGSDLFFFQAGEVPVLKIEVIFQSGALCEIENGQSFFTSKMITEGSAGLTAKQIASKFDFHGSFVEINPGLDQVNLSFFTLSRHTTTLAPFIRDIINKPDFPEEELLTQKRIKAHSIRVNQKKTAGQASRAIRKALFGESHPYGLSIGEEDVEGISRAQLEQFASSTFYSKPTIVVSGGVSDEDISVISSTLGELKVSAKEDQIVLHHSQEYDTCLIEMPESVQSSIRFGQHIVPKNHDDYIDLVILNELFGGYFGSRLMLNIREDKGFTYGIYSSILNLAQGSIMIVGTDVNKENTQTTIDEILKEMEILRVKPVGDQELSTLQNHMIGSFMNSVTTPFSLADKFKAIHFHGLDYEYYHDYISKVRSITPERLMELANNYLRPDRFSTVIAGSY